MKLRLLFLFSLALILSACVSDGPNNTPTDPNAPENFDFSTQRNIDLSLSYGYENYKISFKVYAEYPYNEDGSLKEDVNAIYGAFTDLNSKFESKFIAPAYVSKVYVCSEDIGVPRCIEVEIENNKAEYIYKDEEAQSISRSVDHDGTCIKIGDNKSTLSQNQNIYALYNSYIKKTYVPSNSKVSDLYSIVSPSTMISDRYPLGNLISTIDKAFRDKKNNSNLCSSSEVTNLRIAKQVVVNGKVEDVKSAHVDINYLKALGTFSNAMGYYYYKSDKTLSAAQIKALPKYVVYPRTTNGYPSAVLKARIQFFGENYADSEGTDDFPSGYTIGWFLIPDLGGNGLKLSSSDMSSINNNIVRACGINNRVIYSNKEANYNSIEGCITLTDNATGKIVIGFEDQTFLGGGDHSYDDILFYVDVDPAIAVYDPERPVVPVAPEEEKLETSTTKGTVAFEDIWPFGGDYDMNDVVVEHVQTITYNQDNIIKKIEDKFKAVHNGAKITDAFGFKVNGSTIGTIEGTGIVKEEDGQYIVWGNFPEAIGQEVTVTRTFTSDVNKLYFDASLNLFIVPNYVAGEKNRMEVHLPHTAPTSWVNMDYLNTQADVNYVKKGGLYPFAIQLDNILNWSVPDELVSIGSANAYPNFGNWVTSKGTQYTDWYLNKQ